jgi:hypothetical protein
VPKEQRVSIYDCKAQECVLRQHCAHPDNCSLKKPPRTFVYDGMITCRKCKKEKNVINFQTRRGKFGEVCKNCKRLVMI